jgi:hypothetical protein
VNTQTVFRDTINAAKAQTGCLANDVPPSPHNYLNVHYTSLSTHNDYTKVSIHTRTNALGIIPAVLDYLPQLATPRTPYRGKPWPLRHTQNSNLRNWVAHRELLLTTPAFTRVSYHRVNNSTCARKMSPPRRALFSLNVDSETEHLYQRVDDHRKDGKEKVKVIESSGPTVGHTDYQFVTKPFETLVNRTVDGIVEGSGKKLHSAEGEVTYSSQKSERGTGKRTVKTNRSSTRNIEREYDTSDL